MLHNGLQHLQFVLDVEASSFSTKRWHRNSSHVIAVDKEQIAGLSINGRGTTVSPIRRPVDTGAGFIIPIP